MQVVQAFVGAPAVADAIEPAERRREVVSRIPRVPRIAVAFRDLCSQRVFDRPSAAARTHSRSRLGDAVRFAKRPMPALALIVAVAVAVLTMSASLTLPRLDAVGALPVVTIVSIFVGSLVAGLTGFAFSAIAGALLFHWFDPSAVVPLLLACSVTTQLLSIATLRTEMQWRACIPLLVGGLPGVPVGAQMLRHVGPGDFATGFGTFLVLYSAYTLWRPGAAIRRDGRLSALAVGFAGGVAAGAIAFPGAFPTIWCNLRGLPKETQRGIVQPFILFMQCAALFYFSRTGILNAATAATFVWCAPAVLAGTLLGIRLYRRIDDAMYRRVVLCFLLVSGATLIF